MLGLDKLYSFHRFWISRLFHASSAVFSTLIVSPSMTLASPLTESVRQLSDCFAAYIGFLFDGARCLIKRFFLGTGVSMVTVWTSVLLYASFYHFYVPTASLVRPAHFQFRVCPNGVGMCSFPTTNITLCAPNCAEVLGRGQQYRVILQLLIPDSAPNRDVGMFMIQGKMYDQQGTVIQKSSRAAAVKYQSDTLKLIQTFVLSPFYVTAFAEETQTLAIELFEDFRDDYYQPAVGVLLEIHSRYLSFYSAELQFHACYAGLKYYLFYYPVICAVCGIAFNSVWLTAVFLLTWYRLGLGMLEVWFMGAAGDPAEGPDADGRDREMDSRNGECLRGQGEEAESVRNYIQPFTVMTSAKTLDPAESVGGTSTLKQPVTEALSDQQVKPSNDSRSHIQPLTDAASATKQKESKEPAAKTAVKLKEGGGGADSCEERGKLRYGMKMFGAW
ncbi:seipin-like isoform X2 [Babylonia areolata]|uniref:seipin-like isoform X2 n=1 Tax=Babylonia areolata TaxID=304850 RepID=UPI003FD284C9